MNNQISKSKFKFNVIDFLIIFIVLAVLVSVFLRGSVLDVFKEEQRDISVRYTLIIEELRDTSIQYIKNGTSLYFSDEKEYFGKVSSFSFTPSTMFVELDDGTITEAIIPSRYNVTMEIECKTNKTDTGYMVNGDHFLAKGSVIYLTTSELIFGATVIDFEEIK